MILQGKEQNKRVYLSPPHIMGKELDYVKEAFESNWIAPLGPQVDAFEKEIAAYVGVKSALALSSGTAAIHLALRYLGVGSGDVVFASTLTFIGSVAPVLYQGATLVFIDSEEESWNMSPEALISAFDNAKKGNKLPKAVIVTDLYGQCANYDRIVEICRYYKVPIIEDAAEAIGAIYKNKKAGSLGTMATLSFNGNKIVTTSGGGMLLSDDVEIINRCRFWATQARDPAPWYQHSDYGYNYRMSNICAAIGRAQLETVRERIQTRRKVFDRYKRALGLISGINFMPEAKYGMSNRWLTVITIDSKQINIKPIDIMNALERENIESRPVWKPMHMQPLFCSAPYYKNFKKDVSKVLFESGLCLPSGSNLTEIDQDRIIEIIKGTLGM